MLKKYICKSSLFGLFLLAMFFAKAQKPNIVLIYADDLGYGDLSCYGAVKVQTPNIDALAAKGLRFTNAHASSATCTPSRYGILTGRYPWRKQGTGIAPGDAPMIIDVQQFTVPALLKQAGYATAAIGKWHLGLGNPPGPDWNGEIKPGPLEIGFDYCYIMPATLDRVPCVFIENHHVVNLDPADPITVSYEHPVGNELIAKDHPELLKMQSSFRHNNAIVNGVGRIGFMTGGKSALWVDENIADSTTAHAMHFIEENQKQPFFLYFAAHDVHVPRLPNQRFAGRSGLGPRGDAILELDWTVGKITRLLDSLKLTDNTLVIFTSDNGPVLNDGYEDQAVELLHGHRPAGDLRGGKYSIFDAGTRIPFIVSLPGTVSPGRTAALVSQVDLLASFAALTHQSLTAGQGPDSYNMISALMGRSKTGRKNLVEQASGLAVTEGKWKYIAPNNEQSFDNDTKIELGNSPGPQLYDLDKDIAEKHNLAADHPELVARLAKLLREIQDNPQNR